MKQIILTLAACILSAAAFGQSYDSIAKLRMMNRSVVGVRSMRDGSHYTRLENGAVVRYSYPIDGECDTLIRVSKDRGNIADYSFSQNEKMALMSLDSNPIYRHSYTTEYWLWREGEAELSPMFVGVENTRDAMFAPNGRSVAYSADNNLYLFDFKSGKTTQITTDGEWNKVINGTCDWVYEEEFGFTRGYEFSPDSRYIAYLKFDESQVPMFEMMTYGGELYNHATEFKYPKAGDANSEVELWVYDTKTGAKTLIDSGKGRDQYIPKIGWTDSSKLYFCRLNRLQNHLEMLFCNVLDEPAKVIYEQKSDRYVERVNSSTINFVTSRRYVVMDETRSGYMHLYLRDIESGEVAQLTSGEWDVMQVVGVTPRSVYYLASDESPLQRNLYRVDFDDVANPKRLTTEKGFYSIMGSRSMKYYFANFSNTTTPNRVDLYTGDGELVRNIVSSDELAEKLGELKQPTKEFAQMTTVDGQLLNYYIVKPRDFDPSKKYPVLLTQYSGPSSQQVLDRWGMDWEDALVDGGYIVACVDPRGTGARGEEFKKQTYKELGRLECEDQIAFAKFLQTLPYIDSERVGIYGWSYGGFMSLSAAFRSEGLFKMAIAVAPVTSWRYYDSIYTEIYNSLPSLNPSGYDDNSPLMLVDGFDDQKTQLLIIHGLADDNVHFQNSAELMRKLNQLEKSYDVMIYPDQNHSMMPDDTKNVRRKMVKYTLKNL